MPSASEPGSAAAQSKGRWLRAAAAFAALCVLGPGLVGLPGLVGVAAAAPPDQISLDLTARLATLAADDAAPGNRGLTAAILIRRADLTALAARTATDPDLGPRLGPVLATASLPPLPPAVTAKLPPGPATGARLNMRLALTMLSQAYGDEGNGSILLAQSQPDRAALVLTGGTARLGDLRALLQAEGLPGEAMAGGLELRVPLVIWPGAALQLGPGEVLQLSRPDGAFVMNFGALAVDGATIAGVGDANARVRGFRPFVTTADGGSLQMRGARLLGLGFGDTLKFSGVSVLRSLLRPADRPTRIEASLFEDIVSLGISADAGVLIRDNRFRNARGPALVVVRTPGALILSNLFAGSAPTNAIRLEQGSADGRIAGNVILGGKRAGIAVRDASPRAQVAGNVIWAREGGGILVSGSACGRVEGNLVLGNAQKGIELRNAPGGTIAANSVLSNASTGIWVADQPQGTLTRIEGNVVAFNAAGLAAARGERLLLAGNDLSRQYLQFLSGDLAPQAAHLARDMHGAVALILSAAGSGPATPADLAPDPGPDLAPDPAADPVCTP